MPTFIDQREDLFNLRGGYVVVFNTESLFLYLTDNQYRSLVQNAAGLTCDGIGVALWAQMNNISLHRYHGPDLMHDILTNTHNANVTIIGGSEDDKAGIAQKYNLENRISFLHSKRFGMPSTQYDIDAISCFVIDNKPSVVFVCLGIFKQEHYCNILSSLHPDILFIGTGAAVNFLAGTKKRSSTRWQRVGLEWLPRLIREPRMFTRVLRSFYGLLLACFPFGLWNNVSKDLAKTINISNHL